MLVTTIDKIISIAREAGSKILSIYQGAVENIEVTCKSDNSPLTKADLLAHEVITKRLEELGGEFPILSEESKGISWQTRKDWHCYWLVDPLDGTKEFINRTNEFTVNIALVENHQPVMGVVYAPVLDVMYYASRGGGAYKVERGSTVPIRASSKLQQAVRVVASRRHGNSQQLAKLLSRFDKYELLNVGSSLKICMVAEGKADIYPRLGPTSEWDTAAAHCVLREAGGELVEYEGEELTYNKTCSLLNPSFLAISKPLKCAFM
jgi:3'(2'), 5'-bisphosphate nucleotidase